jgi:hypothetical protein
VTEVPFTNGERSRLKPVIVDAAGRAMRVSCALVVWWRPVRWGPLHAD